MFRVSCSCFQSAFYSLFLRLARTISTMPRSCVTTKEECAKPNQLSSLNTRHERRVIASVWDVGPQHPASARLVVSSPARPARTPLAGQKAAGLRARRSHRHTRRRAHRYARPGAPSLPSPSAAALKDTYIFHTGARRLAIAEARQRLASARAEAAAGLLRGGRDASERQGSGGRGATGRRSGACD